MMKSFYKVLALPLMFISLSAQAAGGVPDTGDIPRAEQPRALPSVPPAEIKKEIKPAYQAPDDGSQVKVSVKSFTFSGNQSFSSEQLSALLAHYKNREIGFKALNEATNTITKFYRDQGYFLAQAYLPAQDIAENKVEIAILEGQLGTLKLKDANDFEAVFMRNMAAYQLSVGNTVSEYNLVRNVTLLNALPGVDATAELKPSNIVGATDIEVTLAPKPSLQGYIGANTYGNRFTGREVVLAGVQWNNPVGLGDQFSLNLKRSNNNGQRGLDLGYITPILASGTKLTLGYNYVDYKLGRELEPLDAFGESQYFNMLIDQPILRDANKGISVRYGASYKVVNDEVETASLENRRNIFGADFGIYGDWINKTGDVSNQIGLNIRTGKVSFKNDLAQTLDTSGARTEGGFAKYGISATRLQYFKNGVSLALQGDYQRASKNLDSVEKISTGGINRWRRFAELPSLADTGFVVGAELRKRIPANKSFASLMLMDISPYSFIDVGRGKINQKTAADDNHVKSIHFGLGLDATFNNTWLFNVTASHHNRDFAGADAENEVRVWGQLLKYF